MSEDSNKVYTIEEAIEKFKENIPEEKFIEATGRTYREDMELYFKIMQATYYEILQMSIEEILDEYINDKIALGRIKYGVDKKYTQQVNNLTKQQDREILLQKFREKSRRIKKEWEDVIKKKMGGALSEQS